MFCKTPAFRRGVTEASALLECCAAYICSPAPTFRDNKSVPLSPAGGKVVCAVTSVTI